jgi:hypothetical protein
MYEQLRTHIAIPHIANKSATKRHKHTRTQRIPNHETTINIYGRDKSAPTPNGMYTNHSWNVRNTSRKIFDVI